MSTPLSRVFRDSVVICLVLALAALVVWPRTERGAEGVLGGGMLMAVAAWAIRRETDGMLAIVQEGRRPGAFSLVKTFTRHAILAAAAYGMMLRLHVDPVALLVGVGSPAIATAIEGIRGRAHGTDVNG